MPLSVEVLGNGTEAEPGVKIEAVVTENLVKRVSDANILTCADFRDLFGAGLAEARMSAALLGCIGP